MTERLPLKPEGEEGEARPEFELFLAIPRSEEWALLKGSLFAARELRELKEQPHGLDLKAAHFVEVDPKSGAPETILEWKTDEKNAEGKEVPPSVFLRPGKEYFVLLNPLLRESYDRSKFVLHLLPRSSLLRAGVVAEESTFFGTEDEAIRESLGSWFDAYYDGRQGAFRIFIANPNGVEVEDLAPVVQVVPERIPKDEIVARTQEAFLLEREQEKRTPLFLGGVSEFLPVRPKIATDPEKSQLKVTQPMASDDTAFHLRKDVPYLLETAEEVSLSAHEVGLTRAFASHENIAAYGDALVDAGYHGKLTYLVIPKEDIVLRRGDAISYLLKVNVPTTSKPYSGHWGKK
ncbi:MAG: hypothetical protein HYT14_00580 [Candidatus Liptonbacteria bacterium]|nr:hypothetical protein [Candidatus Liptonbacteria bacterium]